MKEKEKESMPLLMKEISSQYEGNKKFPFFEIIGKFDECLFDFNNAAWLSWSDELLSVEIIDEKLHVLLRRWDEDADGDMVSWTVTEDYDSWGEFANSYPWDEYFERGKFGLLFRPDENTSKRKEKK